MIKTLETGQNNATSLHCKTRHRYSIGFTLIELLVVLVIIGIFTSMTFVNYFPDHQKALNTETKRITLILSHASEYAKTHGRLVAFDFNDSGYRFYSRDAFSKEWKPLSDDPILRERLWSSGIRPSTLVFNQSSSNQIVSERLRILFSSSGLNEDFTLTLKYDELKAMIHGNLLGQIEHS